MSIITFANQKGGVGKTMTVAATASVLVQEGYKVLLIDLDAQRNLDMVAGHFNEAPLVIERNDSETPSILHVLSGECTIKEAIVPSAIGDLVRASNQLYGWAGNIHLKEEKMVTLFEEWLKLEEFSPSLGSKNLSNTVDQQLFEQIISNTKNILSKDGTLNLQEIIDKKLYSHRLLEFALKEVQDDYDYILIDTNPSLTLLTLNALYACQYVVIPTFPEASSMEAILELSETIDAIKSARRNRKLEIAGILMTKFVPRRVKSKRNAEILRELVTEELGAFLFDTMIRDTERASEYVEANLDIVRHDPTGKTATDYRAFVKELKLRIAGMT